MKIAIIGAGICGLYLAWKLAERGEEVMVFEKRKKIGKEACSGLLSERILEFIPQSEELIENEIEFVLIHFPKRTFKINFTKKFFVISHSKLDKLTAKLAKKAGARIVFGKALDFLPEGFDRIIGCDGASSNIRKLLRLQEPDYRLAVQGFVTKQDYSNYVEAYPVSRGFIWRIPRGKETEYGAIANPYETKNILDDFLAKNKISLNKTIAAMVPQGFILPKNSLDVTLCGDAAGLTKPWSGGGVIWGLMADDILLKNFPDFLKYQKEMKKFFSSKIIFSKFVAKMVYSIGFKFPFFLPKNIKIEGDFLL